MRLHNPQSPIELVTDIQIIEDYETNAQQDMGLIDNLPFYKFRMDLYRNPEGKLFRYCNVEYDRFGSATLVVFHTPKDEFILLQKNYRVFVDQYVWEIPRGFADLNDKSTLDSAIRELYEETSIDLKKIEHKVCEIGRIYPDTGLTNNQVSLYRVDINVEFEPVLKNNDKNEYISHYRLIPVSEIRDFVPQIKDGFTLCALAKAFL